MKSTSLSIDKSIAVSSSTLHSSIYVNISPTHQQPEDLCIPPMNLPSPEALEKSLTLRLSPLAPILRRPTLHHLLLRVRQGILAEATVRQETPARASGTRGFRTARMNEMTLGTTTAPASMLGEILGPGTSRTEEDLRGCDRSRLLETTSTLGEALGDGTIAAPGRALGCCTSSRETLARGSTSEEPKFSSSSFFLEQRPDSRLFRQASRHTAPTKLSPSSARHVSHSGSRIP